MFESELPPSPGLSVGSVGFSSFSLSVLGLLLPGVLVDPEPPLEPVPVEGELALPPPVLGLLPVLPPVLFPPPPLLDWTGGVLVGLVGLLELSVLVCESSSELLSLSPLF